MAIDSYMYFKDYAGNYLMAESQVVLGDLTHSLQEAKDTIGKAPAGSLFEVSDYSFDIEQTLNIGSQSSGAGAGKVVFNPFSVTRNIDKSSPKFFQSACSGTPFKEVCLGLRKSAGGDVSGIFFVLFRFMLAAVKTVNWAHGDESPTETVTFEYGGLQVYYGQQKPNGTLFPTVPGGWDRTKNVAKFAIADDISA